MFCLTGWYTPAGIAGTCTNDEGLPDGSGKPTAQRSAARTCSVQPEPMPGSVDGP